MENTTTTQQTVSEELNSDYANNVFIEPTVWDLKLIFGEFSDRSKTVDWHTAITMPWSQAKLLSYYLQIHIAAYEINSGRISIPGSAIPQPVPELSPEQQSDPQLKALFEMLERHREQFVANLK